MLLKNIIYYCLLLAIIASPASPLASSSNASECMYNIEEKTCNLKVAFNYQTLDLAVKFKNVSLGTYSSLYWDFGDGSTSVQKNPTHIYNQSGNYRFCLSVEDDCTNCSKKYCGRVIVFKPCDS